MDYKDTLNMMQTDFPMRANLPNREPEILKDDPYVAAQLGDAPVAQLPHVTAVDHNAAFGRAILAQDETQEGRLA